MKRVLSNKKPTALTRKLLKLGESGSRVSVTPTIDASNSDNTTNHNEQTEVAQAPTDTATASAASLPTLYKLRTTGALQMWEIKVQGNTIISSHGMVGGKVQSTTDVVTVGKNIGKSNATTPAQQAMNEAKSSWEDKKKSGYVEQLATAKTGAVDASVISDKTILPMLAHKFAEQAHKIQYPAHTQPKYDGERGLAVIKQGQCVLYSRTRKPIPGVPHINRFLEQMFPLGQHIVDGELYNHSYKDQFETLIGYINKKKQVKSGCEEVVQYHIYDYPVCNAQSDLAFEQRWHQLSATHSQFVAAQAVEFAFNFPFLISDAWTIVLAYFYYDTVQLAETIVVQNEEELMQHFDHFVNDDGYEGAMVRNSQSLYENKRSFHLQKIKEFDDAEFKIIGIEEGRGKLVGSVGSFICETDNGTQFKAKMQGEMVRLREFFENHSLWQNKQLTVKYQGLTNKSNVPRFPVGIKLVNYE